MRLTLKSKVLLLAMVPVLLFALVLSGGAVLILKKQADAEVKDTRERLLGDRRAELEHYVQIAMGSIQAEYDRSANGDLNARAEAIARLSKIKYGKDGYIFGYDSQVVRLFRGDSPVDVGKSFRDRRDPSGVYLNRELVEAGRNGSHYVTYTSPLPGNESVMVPKLSYTLYLPKWDMVIGSAINLDGVEAQLVEIKQDIDERIGTLIASIVGIAGVLLVVLLVIGLAVANAMLRPLHQIRQNLDDIAAGEGDLTRRLPVTSHDELGELAGSFNRFVERIHESIREVAGTARQLHDVAQLVVNASNSSMANSDEQSNRTNSVAAAINELGAAAQEIARNAADASHHASDANHQAEDGKQVVEQTIRAMNELSEKISASCANIEALNSRTVNIGQILEVIKGISEQTNLLALNAAIEAARAGEAGRGFAVVADEVRNLAHRAQESAQQIQKMIEELQVGAREAVATMTESQRYSLESVEIANRAGESLSSVTRRIGEIDGMNQSVATATEEQTAVVDSLNMDITEINTLNQEGVENLQATLRACGELETQAGRLRQLVDSFKI